MEASAAINSPGCGSFCWFWKGKQTRELKPYTCVQTEGTREGDGQDQKGEQSEEGAGRSKDEEREHKEEGRSGGGGVERDERRSVGR